MDRDLQHGLGVLLNEADLLGVEFDPTRRLCAVTLRVLVLPEEGPEPPDRRIFFVMSGVSRVLASLRGRHSQFDKAPILPVTVETLDSVVQSFGGLPIYGWEFIDRPLRAPQNWWTKRPSLDWKSHDGAQGSHTLDLFQQGGDRDLDLRIWFESFRIVAPDYRELDVDDLILSANRWWEAMHSGDSRTAGHGIVSGAPKPK